MRANKSRILIADDEPAIRSLLHEFISSLGHDVDTYENGQEALDGMAKAKYDLVISDINMPVMDGIEFLKNLKKDYPHVKRALLTAYNIDDYLQMAMEHDIGNIIPKKAPFNFDDIERVIHNLLTEEIFGMEKHLKSDSEIMTMTVTEPDQIDEVAKEIVTSFSRDENKGRLKLVIVEMLTNAFFYGAKDEDGAKKENWDRDFKLSEEEAILVQWGEDKEKIGIGITDPFGKLSKEKVLYWLSRQTMKNEEGLPVGIFDTHGRGFYIARSYVDSIQINIKPGEKTEIIAICFSGRAPTGYKPIYINEI